MRTLRTLVIIQSIAATYPVWLWFTGVHGYHIMLVTWLATSTPGWVLVMAAFGVGLGCPIVFVLVALHRRLPWRRWGPMFVALLGLAMVQLASLIRLLRAYSQWESL